MQNDIDWDAFLSQSTPRPLPPQMHGFVLKGWKPRLIGLVVGIVLCGILLGAFFPWAIYDQIRLDIWGKAAKGIVTQSIYANRTIGDDILVRKRLVFSISFDFAGPERQTLQGQCFHFGRVGSGTVIDVSYLPFEPNLACFTGGFVSDGGYVSAVWGLIFPVFIGFGLWNYRRWRAKRYALFRSGSITTGIIGITPVEQREGLPRAMANIEFSADSTVVKSVQDVDGEKLLTVQTLVATGGQVRILFDPQWPRSFIVLELLSP